MRLDRVVTSLLAGALLAALVAGCASPATVVHPDTRVADAAATTAVPAPAAEPEPPAAATACSLSRVHFAFDSAQLDGGARSELKDDAVCLVQRKPASATIEGHTDERGTTAYNLALGQRRADSVRGYLQDLGVRADLRTISFGKELPLENGSGEGAWSQNRRAELRLPGERRSDGLQVADR